MNSVVEINAESCGISVSKGFLLVSCASREEKIPLSEIEALIINARAATITNRALARLAEEGVVVVHNGPNSQPVALTLPCAANVYRKQRVESQIACSLPLKKNLWRQVVKAKILNQAKVLELAGKNSLDLQTLVGKVLSGDSGNSEAVAARIYWQRLFGAKFRRKPELPGINGHLNYGYAILRASLCRAIAAAGLIPELGIHHQNMMNPFCLADDLLEPFRPFCDLMVWNWRLPLNAILQTKEKQSLAALLNLGLIHENTATRLRHCLTRCVEQLIRSLETKKPLLIFPEISAQTLEKMKTGEPGAKSDS
ncbi:MAG: type II CRISPR-associated endonuclease Cas1 [Candidatus Cloacimonetes bacterium]|jgi:CRISPR-associated protein Cas1|nr:type II CRISPR-associated endonuclease Cas1 [Candidatus Cloacimonadota bacterium]